MKMGNILSLWRYDLAAGHSLKSARLRPPTIQHYASWIPVSWGGPVNPSIVVILSSRPDSEGLPANIVELSAYGD